MSDEENPFARLERLQKEANDRVKENTLALNKLNAIMAFHRSQDGSSSTQHTQLSQGLHHELKQQTELLKAILLKANNVGGGKGGSQDGGRKELPMYGGGKMALKWDTSKFGQALNKPLMKMANFFGKIGGAIKGVVGKV